MLINHINSFGFIMILNHNDLVKNNIDIAGESIEKKAFINIVKIFLSEIKARYNFSFTDKKINIKATKCTNDCIAILSYKGIYGKSDNKPCVYKIKQPCPALFNLRHKIVVLFKNADDLIDCLYALNHTMLRLKIPFDTVKNYIYLKGYSFLLLIEKSPGIFPCISEICREYGKVLSYKQKIFENSSLLNIKKPIEKSGNY